MCKAATGPVAKKAGSEGVGEKEDIFSNSAICNLWIDYKSSQERQLVRAKLQKVLPVASLQISKQGWKLRSRTSGKHQPGNGSSQGLNPLVEHLTELGDFSGKKMDVFAYYLCRC
ncbi:dotA: Histone-lysine N-methyltransferase H3 lysine-79 specific [Crotalus adamanteus]|uniref:DotA: Histone-lysine N-methyltransferase H3 lysine-79 specific n=1 Tax=Crotalus adamanteus TaxID=8729 RepID=A0AAW1B1X9_CROAD